MTNPPWQPLAQREAGQPPDETLFEGVPAHLEAQLRVWILTGLEGGGTAEVAIRLRLAVNPTDAPSALAYSPSPDIELLTVVDAILSLGGPWPRRSAYDATGLLQRQDAAQMRAQLSNLLDLSSSVYQVNSVNKRLTRRASAASAAAFQEAGATARAAPAAGSADTQIKTAWDSIHALQPDPPKAYREAIKAVESAAHAIIEPNNAQATMGTMLDQMRNNPGRYKLAIPGPHGHGDIAPAIAMMELLWNGQTSRHGAQSTERPETFEQAQMAVHLAVTLVNWFLSGAVQRTR